MSTISNSTNRISGLMSGLDTEELVKAMSANTKSRLNSKKQKLQTLEWKQESYRSIISKISDFKDKYLDILSTNSIKANSVMKKCTATSSNSNVISATASAGATAAKYTISQATAATTASFASNGTVSDGAVKLDFSAAEAGKSYTVEVNLDGTTKKISFTGGDDVEATKANFLNAANEAFADLKGSNQGFEFKSGTSTLVFDGAGDGVYHTFGVGAGESVGLAFSTSSKITTSSKLGSIDFNQELTADADGKYRININGTDFEFDENTTVNEMITEINGSDAGVKLSFSSVSQSFTLETKDTGATAEINMSQSGGNLLNALFNMDSSQLTTTSADKATVEYETVEPVTQNLSSVIYNDLIKGFSDDDLDGDDNADVGIYKINVNIDGQDIALELNLRAHKEKDDGESYTDEEITTVLNDAIKSAYEAATNTTLGDDEDAPFTVEYADKKLTINCDKEFSVVGSNDLYLEQDLTNVVTKKADASYIISNESSLKFNLDGTEITVNASSADGISVNDLINAGVVKMENDGTMIATGTLSAADETTALFLNKYFGKSTDIAGAKDTDTITAHGSNSSITVSSDGQNFMTYTSTSNSFTFDGTSISLSNAGNFVAASEDEYITIDTKRDTSGIKDAIVKFVDDYNTLLEELYTELNTSRPKSSGSYYDPLTEEQEEEMSEDEIENWNENAKKGLLYNDSNLQKFISEFRSAMNTVVDGFTLSSMGITLTDDWSDNGKLEIDESKLDNAIETYGDKIAEFFTSENGLASKLETVVDKAISTKTNKYGYLASIAGIANTKTATDNMIYNQIQSLQSLIDKLTEKYEDEQERYWDRFTTLETYMSQMNQQASYFTTE